MKYRKKPIEVEAHQWFKNGDHPNDDCFRPYEDTGEIPTEPREGAVVRYFRHPNITGNTLCDYCENIMHNHGWIDTGKYGHPVCPSDWIIKDMQGEFYPCKHDTFIETYEAIK